MTSSTSALSSAGSTRRWRRLRAVVLERDGWRCQVPALDGRPCGAYAEHVDHVTARHLGGTDDLANLRAACARCNLRRGTGASSTSSTTTTTTTPSSAGRRWEWD